MKALLTMVPACVAFGPLFMVMGSVNHSSLGLIRYLGALMTTFALGSLLWLLSTNTRQLQRLQSSHSDDSGTPPKKPL